MDNNMTYEQIEEKIQELDLEYKITIINSFIKELKDNYPHDLNMNAISLSISGIEKVTNDIDKCICLIRELISYHKTKFFHGWRELDRRCQKNLIQIILYDKILDRRIDLLIKLSNVTILNFNKFITTKYDSLLKSEQNNKQLTYAPPNLSYASPNLSYSSPSAPSFSTLQTVQL